jgi:ketosteroid isomerase-like protein
MSDREDIAERINELYWAIDDQDADAFRACLTDDCVLCGELSFGMDPIRVEGLEAIMKNFGHAMSLFEREQHFVSNLRVRVDGNTAVARIYQWGPYLFAGVDSDNLAKGGFRVEHQLRRTEYRWLVSQSEYTPVCVEHGREIERISAKVFGKPGATPG